MLKKEKDIEQQANDIVESYVNMFDLTTINNQIANTFGNKDHELKKKTLKNVAKWALNGASSREIANNLELTESNFKILCSVAPVLILIMKDSMEMADEIIAGSLFQTAIGGMTIKEQQLIKVKDYNEDGYVIGEHVETHVVEKQLPPNPLLLKYMSEHKLSEKFGDETDKRDSEIRAMVESMSDEELRNAEIYARK